MLLDNGPHTLVVIPKIQVDDGYGSSKYIDGDPVTVTGSCQPTSAAEIQALGLEARTYYTFITRGPWPWSMVSRIIWEGPDGQWPGREWDQEGEARVYGMSPRTRHVDITLKAREGIIHGSSL